MSRRRTAHARTARWALAILASAAAAAIPASAGMFSYTNDYEGLAERDPGTYLGFDIVRRGDTIKAAKITARLAYTCTSGGGGRATAQARGKLRIRDGAFAGKLEVPPDQIPVRARGAGTMTYAVAGELRRRGRARGTIDGVIRFSGAPRGGGGETRCYSGKVDWRAKRGADVEPDFPKP